MHAQAVRADVTTQSDATRGPEADGPGDVGSESGGGPAPIARIGWAERHAGGSAEAERLLFEQLAKRIMHVQLKTRRKAKAVSVDRAFHAKALLGIENATLRIDAELPPDLAVGHIRPGAEIRATLRLSNASGLHQADGERDMRGMALRLHLGDGVDHDLLATNFPVSHARDAAQFVAFADALAGNRALGLVRLAFEVGPAEMSRMLRNVRAAASRPVASLALESYWSRGAILWGTTVGPVRYLLRPLAVADKAATASVDLRREIGRRVAAGEVAFELCLQRWVDERRTPIEDGSVEWTESVAPVIPIGRVVIPQQDLATAEARAIEARVDQLAFNPWHAPEEFRPLGNLNRARKAVYAASSAHRAGQRFRTEPPLRNRVLMPPVAAVLRFANRFVEWHRLPLRASLLNLQVFREQLRAKNLIDTEPREAPPATCRVAEPVPENARAWRTYDGSWNDLSAPRMGAVGAAFGRNNPPRYEPDRFDEPNPVTVSRELLARETFIPARSLNLLAAAWIQFQVHDWVNHARHKLGVDDAVVPMPDGRTWRSTVGGPEEPVMRIAGNVAWDGSPAPGQPPILFGNGASHWWDGSEVYGADAARADLLREGRRAKRGKAGAEKLLGAKLELPGGYLPTDVNGMEVTGFNEAWWLGLSAMHTLFAREHNVLCDELRRRNSAWNDERVYQTARLIVSALIAKIHTVEWTPAILATEAIDIGLKSNWFGPKDWLTRLGLWAVDSHALKGIPETLPDHHAAPYSLTEDFVTVYRMHPLIPDDYQFFRHDTGEAKASRGFNEIQGRQTDDVLRELRLTDTLYSFGTSHPGAITLHNFPRSLMEFERTVDGVTERVDLSVVDIVRTRRRGVPRYNEFRTALHKPAITRWEDLTADPEDVRKLREIYGRIERVDTVVGLLGETPPRGFGFSDTAFRIFILMASRRLQSDRFLTVDYRPEIYTAFGLDWIARNTMTDILLRNCPGLAAIVPRNASAFAPWRRVQPQRQG